MMHWISKGFLLFVLIASVGCGDAADGESSAVSASTEGSSAAASAVAPVAVSQSLVKAANWELTDANGQQISFNGRFEKPTILLFWATWCPYCKQLMPHLQSVKDQYGDEIDVLALNVFEDDDPVEFLDEYGYQFRLIPDADSVGPEYGVKGTPGLFLVDESGMIRYNLYDVQTSKPIPENIKRWQRAARLAPMWAAELRKVLADL